MRKIISFFLFLPSLLLAQTDILVSGATQLISISTPGGCLLGGVPGVDQEIPSTISRNLELSGYFRVINPASYIESPGKCGGPSNIAYSDWTVIGSDYVVRTDISQAGGRMRVQLYLLDAYKQTAVLGKEYEGALSDARLMAHRFSNEILKFFTGESGPFGSQIAFSMKIGRFKELAVMDMDGSNIRQLTSDKGLAKSAAFSRDGRNVVYTNYKQKVPDIFSIDTVTRSIRQITRGPDLEIGPHFLPDGSIIASRSEGRGSSLVVYGSNGSVIRKVIAGGGTINVSPSISSDGTQMVFCSDQGGSPQIYLSGSDGSSPRRVSFVQSNYCTSPSFSPKGDMIAFVCRAEGGFNLFLSAPDGSNPLQLTSYGNNEDPDWSPDGRYITFSSTAGRGVASLAMIRKDGRAFKQLTNARNGDSEPSWGPTP